MAQLLVVVFRFNLYYMKRILLRALFMSAICSTSAQSSKNVEKGLLKVNAFIPGISYELGVGNTSTFNFDALLIPGGGTNFNEDPEFGLFYGFQAEYRYFTNLNRRLSKMKNIEGNSGNYIALNNQIYSGRPLIGDYYLNYSYNHIVAMTYGIQRTRSKGFYWNVSFGPGVFITESDLGATLMLDLKLGWVVKKNI